MTNISGNVYDNRKYFITRDGKIYEKPSNESTIGAGIFGLACAKSKIFVPIKQAASKQFVRAMNQSQNDKSYKIAAQQVLKNSGLAEKGVQFVEASLLKPEELAEIARKSLDGTVTKFLPQKYITSVLKQLHSQLQSVIDGQNALFVKNLNKIIINMDKNSIASFHEMGHALISNSKGLSNIFKCIKLPSVLLSSIVLYVAAFKRKKVEGEETNGLFDKMTTFIKNNAGKLAFLSFLPTLAEEGLASVKGAKLAKPLLSPESYKNLNVLHSSAFVTYLVAAGCFTLSVKLASWLHDKISAPKRVA